MKRWSKVLVVPAGLLLIMFSVNTLLAAQEGTGKPSKAEVMQRTKKLQMPFIANEGQADERVMFYANTFGGTVFVTKDGEIVYALPGRDEGQETRVSGQKSGIGEISYGPRVTENGTRSNPKALNLFLISYSGPISKMVSTDTDYTISQFKIQNPKSEICNRKYNPKGITPKENASSSPLAGEGKGEGVKAIALKEELVGGKINEIKGEAKAVTKVNYFKGKDPSQWKTNISTYDTVTLGEIYKGIELKLKAYGNNVEKLFHVKPDANPDQIKVKLSGAKVLKVNEEGQLEAETDLGTVKFTRPVAYQEIDGKRVEVAVEYDLQGSGGGDQRAGARGRKLGVRSHNTKINFSNPKSAIRNPKSEYGFKVASYDRTKELVIDPLLASTYLGESDNEIGYSLAIDKSGNIYITGLTYSSDFPTIPGAYDTSYGRGGDTFVSKLNGNLTEVLASTFLGGSSFDSPRVTNAISIDKSGNIYVAGLTSSSDFPTTPGAYDTLYGGGDGDVFISKLNDDLTSLLASTFLGGSAYEEFGAIALDAGENIYVVGATSSTNFPTTSTAYDISYNDGTDAFVSKLSSNLTTLLASTYLGGSYNDICYSIALDSDGYLHIAGFTYSSDFPTTAGTYDTSFNSISSDYTDVFISKLNSDLTNLIASTYLGGTLSDIAILFPGSNGNIYVVGTTYSSDFPTTSGAYDTSYNGGTQDIFISRLNGDLTNLEASTFLGGSSVDTFFAIGAMAKDSNGNIYVFGITSSLDFPTTAGAYDTSYNGGTQDIFISRLNGDLTNLEASTFLGGSNQDDAYGIITDSGGNLYVAGFTDSSDFPITLGAYDTSYTGAFGDAFISKLNSNLSAQITPEVIPAEVDIKPETINLKSKGSFKAFIKLPSPYDVNKIVTATVKCEGADAIDGKVDKDRFIATFKRQDLDLDSDEDLTVTGELEDGTKFEGSDIVKIIK